MIYLEGQEKYFYWLARIPGIGIKTIKRIMLQYPELEELYNDAVNRNTFDFGVSQSTTDRLSELLYQNADISKVDSELELYYNKGIYVISYISDEYPERLREIYTPPSILYARGDLSELNEESFGIVGTRHATRNAIRHTEEIAEALSNAGISVVSGMAAGIDSAAHEGALKGNSATVAVLGCGVDVPYPRSNENLYYKIIEQGAVISEYPPGTPATSGNFPARNRIITGITKGILVSEGKLNSGASISANYALEQNRDVFALPADISLPEGMLPNKLISEGAYICLGAESILEHLGYDGLKDTDKNADAEEKAFQLDFLEQSIYNLLMQGDLSLEALISNLSCETAELMEKLTMLEIMGAVEKLPGNTFHALR